MILPFSLFWQQLLLLVVIFLALCSYAGCYHFVICTLIWTFEHFSCCLFHLGIIHRKTRASLNQKSRKQKPNHSIMLRCGALCSAYMRSFKRFGYSLADILIMCTGWCFVCNISLSPETANEHFESRTHLNRCLQKGIGISVVPSSGIESISHFKCCIFIHESFILVLSNWDLLVYLVISWCI